MNNKRGFTLAELLGVIALLALISIIAFPPILDSIRKSKSNLDETTKSLIYGATNIYVSNRLSTYPIVENNVYCVKLQDLVDSGNLIADLKNANTNESIDLNKYVKVTIQSSKYVITMDDNNECPI